MVCLPWQPFLLESRCPRGGGVAWAGVIAVSATASEEPCRCSVETPARTTTTERATLRFRPPTEYSGAVLTTSGEEVIPNSASPANPLARAHQTPSRLSARPSTTRRPYYPHPYRRLLPKSRLSAADEPPAEEAHEAAHDDDRGDGDARDRAGREAALVRAGRCALTAI